MPVPHDLLYHYTSATAAVESILPTGLLRLGLFDFTNDPRESTQWHLSASIPEGVDLDPDGFQAMSSDADNLLRRSVKLACFTEDAPPRSVLDAVSGRGFGHSRLWSHYAGNHSGVCLGFDRGSLLDALAHQLSGHRANFDGPVNYVANPWPPHEAIHVDVEQVDEFGLDALIALKVERHWRELFFTKDLDWASEHEYRWVVMTDEPIPLFVDISECVRVVVLGDRFPLARMPAVRHAANRLGDVEITAMKYMNGRPQILPVPAPPTTVGRQHIRTGDVTQRAEALANAERDAAKAREAGERYVAATLATLLHALDRCAGRIDGRADVAVELHDSGFSAVPLEDRQRAPGVTRGDVVYSGGRMCVAEHQPQYSFTFVVAVAAQVLTGNRIRLHAAMTVERWRQSGNEQQELWRRRIDVADTQDPIEHATALASELEEYLPRALAAFDAMRAES